MDDGAAAALGPWFDTCHRLGLGLDDAVPMAEHLLEAYRQPHRRYHTLEHVTACLDWACDAPLTEPDARRVELALWFHDVVYDPRRDDNEQRSAELASTWMARVGLDGADEVAGLIVMTAHHQLDPGADLPMMVVHDVDLAILGADAATYRRYVDAIRDEYGWLDAETFVAGRARVLRGLLDRDPIYCLEAYRGMLEDQARRNLTGELDALGSGPDP